MPPQINSGVILRAMEGRDVIPRAMGARKQDPDPVSAVVVSPPGAGVRIAGTTQLTAVAKDSVGGVLTGRVVTWGSSDPTVATVNYTGLVTGVAAGTATITATSETKSGTSAITVSLDPN
jgi:uncharacterized protein YjdB